MAKKDNQKTKLLWILKILWNETDENHGLSTEELRSALENVGIPVTRQCLYNDIDTICDFGIMIEREREGHSVIYKIVDRTFQLAELKLLVDSVKSSHFLTEKKSIELATKLSSLTSRHEAISLKRTLYTPDKYRSDNEHIYYTVDGIHTAMENNKKITFKYFEYNVRKEKVYRHNEKIYKLSPWGLSWNDGNYYMIAFDDEAGIMKNFRVDKMESVKSIDEQRSGTKQGSDLNISSYSKEMFNMFHGEDTRVTLLAENSQAGVIIDRFGYDTNFYPAIDGHFIVKVRVCVSPQFFGWIMSFGKHIKIIEPENVVNEYHTLAREILDV